MKKIFVASLVFALFSCNNVKKEQVGSDVVEVQSEVKEFSKKLSWNNTSFDIELKNDTLSILPSGLEIVNDKFTHPLEGVTVTNAEVADLNGDGHAEVLVYLTSDGSGSYGEVIVYSVNNGKSMSQVHYATEHDSKELMAGYMGHDRFAVEDGVLTRTFPVYNEEDSNANPTGGTRKLLYKLVDGEASRQLVVDRIAAVL